MRIKYNVSGKYKIDIPPRLRAGERPVPIRNHGIISNYPDLEVPIIKDRELTVTRTHKSIGDAVMMLGGIQDLADRGIEVHLRIHKNSYPLFLNHPSVYKLLTPFDKVSTKTHVELSNPCPASMYETSHGEIKLNRIDIFGLSMGSQTPTKPRLHLTQEELEDGYRWIENQFGTPGKVVGMVYTTAKDGWYRSYPYMKKLMKILSKDYQVICIDDKYKPRRIVNTFGRTLRELASIMYHLDLVVTADTGPMHIAGALDIPMVALFGPTDGQVRCSYYDKVEILSSRCDRMPCWYDYCGKMDEPQKCMKDISIDRVVAQVTNML